MTKETTEWDTLASALDELTSELDKLVASILAPPPTLLGSEWANEYLVLAKEAAAEPGPYRWERAAFQREMLDVACDSEHQEVVMMLPARVGKTTVLLAASGFFAHQEPSPSMFIGPTSGYVRNFTKNSLEPMFRASETLRALLIWDTKDANNTLTLKRFKTGGYIYLAGAESPSQIRGQTIRLALADEIEVFPENPGEEGSPIQEIRLRTSTFQHRRKIIYSSTPLIKHHSRIEELYEASDKRQYYVPCPECSHMQVLDWDGLIYKDMDSPHYSCKSCGYLIHERYKNKMVAAGEWRKGNPDSDTAGFHTTALISPFASWVELVREWKDAQKNNFLLQKFLNTRLAQTYDVAGSHLTQHDLNARLERYEAEVPAGVGVLTAGVDVQTDRIEIGVYGWSIKDEAFLIDYRVITGDTSATQVWSDLANFFIKTSYKTKHGVPLKVKVVAIDSGYLAQRVYQWTAQFSSQQKTTKAYSIKGRDNYPKVVDDIPKRSKRYKAPFRFVGTNHTKDYLVAGILQNDTPGPGYLHIPVTLPRVPGMSLQEERFLQIDYLEQMTAERQVFNPKTRRRAWHLPDGKRNEALDTFVYAFAAFRLLGAAFMDALERRIEVLKEPPVGGIVEEEQQTVIEIKDNRKAKESEAQKPKVVRRGKIRYHKPMNRASFSSIFKI